MNIVANISSGIAGAVRGAFVVWFISYRERLCSARSRLRQLLLKNGHSIGLSLFLAAAAALAQGHEPALVDPGSAGSAYRTAQLLLKHLAAGDIEQAARLSNAPRSRYEVLRDYRAKVGEEEFKRVFGRYFDPQNRLVAEYALGPRRLLNWDLGEAAHHLAGQYYIEIDGGKFVMDDAPSEERSRLRRVLQDYWRGKAP